MTDLVSRQRRIYLALVVLGILLFSVGTTYMNWVKFVSVRSSHAYDLGYYHNSVFNYAHGRGITYVLVRAFFDRRDHQGPSLFRHSHFSPMQLLLIPQLYQLWPHIGTLFILQSLVIGMGALPLFLFGTQRTREPRLGLLLALSYLLHPLILHMAFSDYRPIQLGISLALFAMWFHASRKPVCFATAALLMLSCRAEFTFLLALFGVINWRVNSSPERRVRWVVAPLLLAGLWAALTNVYYLYFFARPWPLLAGTMSDNPPGDVILNLLQRPAAFLRNALLPAVLGLLVPEALFAALPFVAAATTVTWPEFPQTDLRHLSPAIAVVFWAFACGIVRLWPWLLHKKQRVAWMEGLLLTAALVSVAQFGWRAAQTYLVGGYPRYEEITRVNEILPADATVMVSKELMARFSNHTRVFTYRRMPFSTIPPSLSPAEIRALFVELISVCDLIVTEDGEEWIDDLVVQSGRYLPVQIVSQFHVFVAKKDAPRPLNPDLRLQEILRWDQMNKTQRRWADIVAKW